jgi:hypothetical protein
MNDVLLIDEEAPMSLKSSPIPPIPEVTACVAHTAFPHGNTVMQLRDALGSIYTDEAFADLFPTHGQPAEARFPPGTGHRLSIHGRLDRSPSR